MGIDENREQLLLTPAQVAQLLSLSERFVRELIYSGELPSLHIGRVRRILRTDLERFIRERAEVQSLVTGDRSRRRKRVLVG